MKDLHCSAVEGFIWFFVGGIFTLLAVLAWLYRGKLEDKAKEWTHDIDSKFKKTTPVSPPPDVVAPVHPPATAGAATAGDTSGTQPAKKSLPPTATTAKASATTAKPTTVTAK